MFGTTCDILCVCVCLCVCVLVVRVPPPLRCREGGRILEGQRLLSRSWIWTSIETSQSLSCRHLPQEIELGHANVILENLVMLARLVRDIDIDIVIVIVNSVELGPCWRHVEPIRPRTACSFQA